VGNMSLAKIGCALSHVGVYKEIISNNHQKVLILEDDLNVNHNAVESFTDALNELPKDWELLYLGYSGSNSSPSILHKVQNTVLTQISRVLSKSNRFRKLDPEIIKNSLSKPYSKSLNRSGANFGTHAYGVTIDGAKKILCYQTPVVQESDNVLGELCSYRWINSYDVKEEVFYQNKELPSTIDK
jgi:glycosyl transferase family 25